MTRLGFLPVACLLFAAALASAQQPPSGRSFHDRYAELVANPRRLSDSSRLGELFRVNWEYLMTEFPEFATYVGDPGQNARWTDNSLQAIERRKRELEEPLAVVKTIRRDRLSPTDRLNYDLFRRGLDERIEGTRFKDEYFAVTQLDGVQQDVGRLLAQMPTTSVQDYENILARLNGVPALIDQTIILLGKGLESGITPPRVTLRDVPDQIRGLTPDDPAASPLLRPFSEFPSSVPASERERLTRAARDPYTQRVAPAYRQLYDYVAGTYVPETRESIGMRELPDGAAWYAYRVRPFTTTNLPPDQIQALGLPEAKPILALMDSVIASTGFKGSFADFARFLRTDPQ